MRRRNKVFLSIGVALLVLILILYGAILYIQSSYLKSKIIPQAIAYVESHYPVKLSMQDIHLHLFKGVVVSGFKCEYSGQPAANLSVNRMAIRYSLLSLISKHLVIDKIDLENVDLSLKGEIPVSQSATASSVSLPANPLTQLSNVLSNLPMSVAISRVHLFPIRLTANLSRGSQQFEVHLDQLSVDASAKLNKDALYFQLSTSLPEPKEKGPAIQAQLSKNDFLRFTPVLDSSFEIRATRSANELQIEIPNAAGSVKVLNLQSPEIHFPLDLKADFGLQHQGKKTEYSFAVLPIIHSEPNIKIEKGISAKGNIVWASMSPKVSADYSSDVDLPVISKDQLRFEGGKLTDQGHLDLGDEIKLENKLELALDALITGYEQEIPIPALENGARITNDLSFSSKTGLQIHDLKFSNPAESIGFNLSGRLSPSMKEITLQGNASLGGKTKTSEKNWQASGEISVPWKFNRVQGGTLILTSNINARGFSAANKDFAIKNLNSRIPIDMEFIWSGGRNIRFSYLMTRNPFERVDYSDIRPYVVNSQTSLKFDQLRFKTYHVGPLYADVSIRQNFIVAEEYQMNLFDGLATGHMFVDLFPGQRRLGFLGRVVGIDPRAMRGLPAQPNDKRISSRVAAVYDFDKSLVDGRLDITEIGGPQLIELINIIDPDYKDSKLNLARSLLKVAHPRYVGIRMSQGFMDLSVDMGGLVSVSDLGIRGVPLTPVLAMMKQNLIEKIEKGNE